MILSDKIDALKARDQELYAGDNKDPFGPATYVTKEITEMAKKAAQITVKYDGMDVISEMLDDHTYKTIALLDEGSRAIQAHANGVVSNFYRFIEAGPVKIKYDKGDVSGKKAAEEEYAQASQHYLNHVHHIVMDAAKFGDVKSSLSGAIALLKMQTELVGKDEVYTKSNHNATILNLIKFIKSMQEYLTIARQKRDGLIIELRQFLGRKPSQVPTTKGLDYNRTTGRFVARYKAFDPMFFEIAISYIEYVMATYKLEVKAREVTIEVTKIKNLQWFKHQSTRPLEKIPTPNLKNMMEADIASTNANLNRGFKKLSSTANNFLENYSVPTEIKNLPTTGKTSTADIYPAALALISNLNDSGIEALPV